jgi:hypothetical protein
MADRRPTCRPVTVEVDGETVHARVRSTGPVTDADRAIVAAAAREFRRLLEEDPTIGERQDAAAERIRARRAALEADDA